MKRRRRIPAWRLAGYGLLFLCALLWVSQINPTPQAALNGLLDKVEAAATVRIHYRYKTSNVTFIPTRGWILVLFVAGESDFAPARYLILERRDALLSGELMIPPEVKGNDSTMTRLTGLPLKDYLARSNLDLSRIEGIYARLYATWPPAPAPG